MTIRFYLPFDKRENATIWLRVRTSNKNIRIATPEKISPADWDAKAGRAKKVSEITDADKAQSLSVLQARLDAIHTKVNDYAATCQEADLELDQKVIENLVAPAKTASKVEVEKAPRDISKYLGWLIERMKDGRFKIGAESYDADTIKVWITFKNMYDKFAADYLKKNGKVLTWSSIDKDTFDAFVLYMDEVGYMVKTQNKYILTFKAAIKYASAYHHLHMNLECLQVMKRREEKEGCAATKTYLNADEVQALYDMKLAPGSLKDQVRDIFLVGVYTCQRCSDYNNLTESNFGKTANGTEVIRLVQEKTNRSVVIPITNNNLRSIAEKYNYHLPHIKGGDVIINRYLKTILKELAESVPSLNETFQTTLTLPERRAEEAGNLTFERDDEGHVIKRKYELISTHSARRSGITNLYKTRMFSNLQIMSISGHATEAIFRSYISQSSDELAEEIDKIIKAEKDAKKNGNEELF